MTKTKQDDPKARKFLDKVHKDFGEDGYYWLSEPPEPTHKRPSIISTGFFGLDLALTGGIRTGRITEIFGPESVGKSTLGFQLLEEIRTTVGGLVSFIDVESCADLNLDFYVDMGVDIESILLAQPHTAEKALNLLRQSVQNGDFSAIVLDSIAALTPELEIESKAGEYNVALQARTCSGSIRGSTVLAKRVGTTLVFMNQVRDIIGGFAFGPKEKSPGPRVIKFLATHRIKMRRVKTLKYKGEQVGHMVCLVVEKNKAGIPRRECYLELMYDHDRGFYGYNREGDLIETGLELGILRKSGSIFRLGKTIVTKKGREGLRVLFRDNKNGFTDEFRSRLKPKIQKICRGKRRKDLEATHA